MTYIHPFQLDKTLYPVGVIHDDDMIDITYLKRNQFPPEIINSFFNVALNKGHIQNFDCFYTGVNCWVGKRVDRNVKNEKVRFILSKEHLASMQSAKKLGIGEKAHKSNNLIGVSSYFNHKLGHIPLVLKLYIKEKLKDYNYSKSDLTKENCKIILGHIIEIENQFLYKGLYPWQPHTYMEQSSQKVAENILFEMLEIDKEFLSMSNIKESYHWLKNYDATWIEKFIGQY